jgi:hypothetical protein
MKNLYKNIATAFCLVSLAASLNACGRAELTAMPQIEAGPVYSANTLDAAPISNQLLIKFKTGITKNAMDTFHSKYGVRTIKILPLINVHLVETPVDIRATQLVKYLENDPMVEYAEVNTSINLNPDVETEPVYSISGNVNYSQMIGKQTDVIGSYNSSRSGAVITVNNTTLSVVDLDGKVITKLPGTAEGSRVSITGIIREVKGFNITRNLGIMPVAFNKVK